MFHVSNISHLRVMPLTKHTAFCFYIWRYFIRIQNSVIIVVDQKYTCNLQNDKKITSLVIFLICSWCIFILPMLAHIISPKRLSFKNEYLNSICNSTELYERFLKMLFCIFNPRGNKNLDSNKKIYD